MTGTAHSFAKGRKGSRSHDPHRTDGEREVSPAWIHSTASHLSCFLSNHTIFNLDFDFGGRVLEEQGEKGAQWKRC